MDIKVNVIRIEIFDIDGTICESFFPNLGDKADKEQLKTKILGTPLFSDFIKFFRIIARRVFKIFNILKIAPSAAVAVATPAADHNPQLKHQQPQQTISAAISIPVYDDLCEYYPKLLESARKLGISKINTNIVKNPDKFWKLKINKGLIK